jgi:predicted RNase H-like HicB family nuclease
MAEKDLAYYEALPYRTDLYFEPEDDAWIVTFPELPGCVAHGATREEALAAGDDIKSAWLETALEKGALVPEPQPAPSYSGRFGLRIGKSLHERAAQVAQIEGLSLNGFVAQAIAEAVERAAYKPILRYVETMLGKIARFLPKGGTTAVRVTVEECTFGDDDAPMPHAEMATSPRTTPSVPERGH